MNCISFAESFMPRKTNPVIEISRGELIELNPKLDYND